MLESFPVLKHYDPDFPVAVAGLMRLATKYQVDSLCKRIANHLEQQWPKTLEEYAQLQSTREAAWDIRTRFRTPPVYASFPEPAAAISLAVEYNIPSILPAAFYALAMSNPELNAWDCALESSFQYDKTRPARWSLLDKGSLLRCYQGKHTLSKKFASIATVLRRAFLARSPGLCRLYDHSNERIEPSRFSTPCNQTLHARSNESVLGLKQGTSVSRAVAITHQADPLMKTVELIGEVGGWGLCDVCQDKVDSALAESVHALWNELPKIFDLE